jgi:hypothetical protein
MVFIYYYYYYYYLIFKIFFFSLFIYFKQMRFYRTWMGSFWNCGALKGPKTGATSPLSLGMTRSLTSAVSFILFRMMEHDFFFFFFFFFFFLFFT